MMKLALQVEVHETVWKKRPSLPIFAPPAGG